MCWIFSEHLRPPLGCYKAKPTSCSLYVFSFVQIKTIEKFILFLGGWNFILFLEGRNKRRQAACVLRSEIKKQNTCLQGFTTLAMAMMRCRWCGKVQWTVRDAAAVSCVFNWKAYILMCSNLINKLMLQTFKWTLWQKWAFGGIKAWILLGSQTIK